MIVLGIETSCDDTSVALVTDKGDILANEISSQIDVHSSFGGVVPELAARAHLENIDVTYRLAMQKSGVSIDDIFAIAATCGPGLIGGVIVGATFGKTISAFSGKPFYAVNHLEGHALSARLGNEKIEFPYLLLLVSGGHCLICIVKGPRSFEVLGQTLDDSVGEAFDKVAKMLGLGYPGGPAIQEYAQDGDPFRFDLPKPLYKKQGCNMSFSGLKTAVRLIVEKHENFNINDLCASFQRVVSELLFQKCEFALECCNNNGINISSIVVGGGVAANTEIRAGLSILAKKYRKEFFAPSLKLCTDNAAMIAWSAIERIKNGDTGNPISFRPKPRWMLGE